MAKIVRHQSLTIHGDDGELAVRLKKWSAAKLFYLIREFWAMIEKGLEGFSMDEKISEFQIVKRIIESLLQADHDAAKLIQQSVDDPKDITTDAILDWDADDFLVALTAVVEMNLTDELVKNFQKLLANFQERRARSKKKTEPAEVSSA